MPTGSLRWRQPWSSPLSTSPSLSRFGKDSPTSTWTRPCGTPSAGSSHLTVSTPLPRHTGLSLLVWWARKWTNMYGKTGHPQSANSLPGSLSTIGFGRLTDCTVADGRTATYVRSANKFWKWRPTFSSSADTLFGFGTWSKLGWLSMMYDPTVGGFCTLLRNDGVGMPLRGPCREGRLPPWWCSSLRKYGRSAMPESSVTRPYRLEWWSPRSRRSARFGA